MKKSPLILLLLAVLCMATFADCVQIAAHAETPATPNVYVGVDISYGDVAEARELIDQVSGFTNLFCVGTSRITWYPQSLADIFQYAYDKEMYFMSLPTGFFWPSDRQQWYANANATWGDKLLGFYYHDEPGGKQLDRPDLAQTHDNSSYSAAAEDYVRQLSYVVGKPEAEKYGYQAFTSDYALYWFDYKAGYDAIFAEYAWNHSRHLSTALCRGAAEAHGKDWGAMITWTYMQPPYIESGEDLYNDMVFAYNNGAKYILIFDGNEGWTGGILQQEHLDALQRFWDYQQTHPPQTTPKSERTAYVLPKDYGYGFRRPNDNIWGLWECDDFSYNLSTCIGSLIEQYGENLDIIYDDGLAEGNNGYGQLLYWDTYTPPQSTAAPSWEPTSTATSIADAVSPAHSTLLLITATIASTIAALSIVFLAYQRKQHRRLDNPKTT